MISVRELPLPYTYVNSTDTLHKSRGTVGGAETEKDVTYQSGLSKQQCTEQSSTHQAVVSAATGDPVWFPLTSSTPY